MLKKLEYAHGFHLVTASPWPFFTSVTLFCLVLGLIYFFNHLTISIISFFGSLFILFFILYLWWWDVIKESTFEGNHTISVQNGIRMGFILFIISEIMFFFGFFWAFFHSSLAPAIQIGGIWPPEGIIVFEFWRVPLLNTIILLSSGACITWAHAGFFIKTKKYFFLSILGLGFFKRLIGYHDLARIEIFWGLLCTIILGFFFTLMQGYEYLEASFNIADSIYGAIFFLTTGFHGLHVIIGTIFLLVIFHRHIFYHFSYGHYLGFELAAWYWHFVDVVWLFLYIFIYCWGY